MFATMPITVNLALFAVAAAAIWWAGTRLERISDSIARRTGLGAAFSGLVLLAVATSLPEVATTVTALLAGNPELAVHNLLGGTAFQVVVLTIADATVGRGPLTRFAPSYGLLIEGVGVVFMLAVAVAALVLDTGTAVTLPGGLQLGVDPVALTLPLVYVAVLVLTRRAENRPRWRPVGDGRQHEDSEQPGRTPGRLAGLGLRFALLALLVTAGGWAAATTADVLAVQTGLGSGFVGATLLAAATSLPEVSTTTAAVRHGNEDVAVSNIFGSNGFDVALLALVSIMAVDSLASSQSQSAVFTAALAIGLTCVYLYGLLERSDRAVSRLGIDSIVVLVLYIAGMGVLYGIG